MEILPSETAVAPPLQVPLGRLRRRTSMKWRTYPADVLPLWVAEMDVDLAEPVVRAVSDALALGDTGYPAGTAYAEALAEFAAKRWGWEGLAVERTAVVPDVMLGVVEMLRLVSGPGDAVVVNSPVYTPFYQFVGNLGRVVVEAPLTQDGRIGFGVLEETFARLRAAGGRPVYLLCSPHNPTGTLHTAAELAQVAALARAYGVRVVADEIHAPVVSAGSRFVPYLSVAGAEGGLSLMSASKAWNLAGLKAAVAVAGPEAGADLARLPEEVGHGASHLGVIAHTAALRDGGDWLDALLTGLDANRRLLSESLAAHLPSIRYTPAPATYLAWLDCRPLELSADPASVFLDRGRVALNSGPSFGTGGEGFVRLNLATSAEVLEEGVRRMAGVFG
ncbi:MalY/PatB family protein [Streptomyces sp. NPDC004539]|uniref:MalY/PatB family protein n=1 Tax=Streptomyces sp. NPDC004539 TaxID=3154280 RepID=UPI0033A81C2B